MHDVADQCNRPGPDSYTLSKLLEYAQDWEKDKVAETETALAAIRYEASCVMKALSYLNMAAKKA